MEKHKQKSTYIILVPSQRYQDIGQLLQNPKFPKNVLGFSNHAQRFTPPYYLNVDNPLLKIWKIPNISCKSCKCHVNIIYIIM